MVASLGQANSTPLAEENGTLSSHWYRCQPYCEEAKSGPVWAILKSEPASPRSLQRSGLWERSKQSGPSIAKQIDWLSTVGLFSNDFQPSHLWGLLSSADRVYRQQR